MFPIGCIPKGRYRGMAPTFYSNGGSWNYVPYWFLDAGLTQSAGKVPPRGASVVLYHTNNDQPGVPLSLASLTCADGFNAGGSGIFTIDTFIATGGSISGDFYVTGSCMFSGSAASSPGNMTLRNSQAANFNGATNGGTVVGDARFIAGGSNTGTVQGNAEFRDADSNNAGTVNGNADAYYPAPYPIGGTVNGSRNYHDYPPQPFALQGSITQNPDVPNDITLNWDASALAVSYEVRLYAADQTTVLATYPTGNSNDAHNIFGNIAAPGSGQYVKVIATNTSGNTDWTNGFVSLT